MQANRKRKQSEIVRQAKCLIEKVGWTRKALAGGHVDQETGELEADNFCIIGALTAAEIQSTKPGEILRAAGGSHSGCSQGVANICYNASRSPSTLMGYNDSNSGSREWAMATLEEMAEHLEKRGL